ncbi:MAG: cyclopropane-fatty-acyl-phospholipid synthase family protein [Dokdonella sp.]
MTNESIGTLSSGKLQLAERRSLSRIERVLRERVLGQLEGLVDCQLVIDDGEQIRRLGRAANNPQDSLHAHLTIHDPAVYRAIAFEGSVGAGESYMDGLWDCDNLVALVRILVRNRDHLDALDGGSAKLAIWAMRAWHALNRNTRGGSRRNVAAHYDIGNALFRLFLDERMMYSSAIYSSPDDSLEHASTRKLERICAKLDLQPSDRVIEIGTGWGGFALHAAINHGCHVTTTTLSREQYDLACERVQADGMSERIEVLLRDYRDIDGTFDKLVSIEMIEAIGHRYLDTYFGRVSALLKPDGMALIQAITIEDRRYDQALKSVDFIQRHIFPGSFIPAIGAMASAIARSSDMKLFNLEDIGPSYAETLKAWRVRFLARRSEARALGYPERFVRMWEFYFAYCEGGFRERSIGDVQMLLTKPRCQRQQFAP